MLAQRTSSAESGTAPLPQAATLTPRGERRRALILDGALETFAERGYHAASIADIAERAQVAKSVIYDHFASKSELHRALVESEAQALLEHIAAAVPDAEAASQADRLRAGVDACFAYVERHPAAWRLLIRDAPVDPELVEVHARVQAQASQAILLLIAPEPPEDADKRRHKEMFAELLKTAISGLANWWYDHPETRRDELVEAVMQFAWLGLERHISGA